MLLQVTIERVFQLVDVQLKTLIISFTPIEIVFQREVDEETNIVFHTISLHLSIFQLLQCNLLEVLLEEQLRSILFDRTPILP